MRTILIIVLVLLGLFGGLCSYLASFDFVGGGSPTSTDVLVSLVIAVVPFGLALLAFLKMDRSDD